MFCLIITSSTSIMYIFAFRVSLNIIGRCYIVKQWQASEIGTASEKRTNCPFPSVLCSEARLYCVINYVITTINNRVVQVINILSTHLLCPVLSSQPMFLIIMKILDYSCRVLCCNVIRVHTCSYVYC